MSQTYSGFCTVQAGGNCIKIYHKNQGARKRPAFIGLVDFPFGIEIVKKSAFLFQFDPGVDIVDPNLIGLWQ
jgi:hypothetical protein